MRSPPLLTIGEVSRAVNLTVKTLRLYHERGLLEPSYIDPSSGYRYYDARSIELARLIARLRKFEFSLEQIGEILGAAQGEEDLLAHYERQVRALDSKMAHYEKVRRALSDAIMDQTSARSQPLPIVSKEIPALLVLSIRAKGAYAETGSRLGKLTWAARGRAAGPPLNLYYDEEMREGDADFETCLPIAEATRSAMRFARELPGGTCWSVVHVGPYGTVGRSYERLLQHAKGSGATAMLPTREIYLKGPGMVFRGKPETYRTELQMFLGA